MTKRFKIINYSIFAIIFLMVFTYPVAYFSSTDTVIITVNDKERITTGSGESMQSKFIIYTDKGVFENTDSFVFFKFNSADLQNELKPNQTYQVQVAGWRVPFLSLYQNIIGIK